MFKGRFGSSIRQKILIGYYILVMIILTAMMLLELNIIKKRVIAGEVISDFFDNVLEIKRFEKNYFLYHQETDYLKNLASIEKVEKLIVEHRPSFTKLVSKGYLLKFEEDLKQYQQLVGNYHKLARVALQNKNKPEDLADLEKKIRMKGREIVSWASHIAKEEREEIQKLLSLSQFVLIFFVVLLSVLSVILGRVLSQAVVKRLKSMEEMTAKIASGEFKLASANFSDVEIVSLCKAFDRVIKELKLKEKQLIQSEKLASLGTLLSGVAHELNNPLANISSSCQILQDELEEADLAYKRQLLNQIETQTDRARDIVRTLLEFSRKKEFIPKKLSLNEVIKETVTLIQGEIPTKVQLMVDIPKDISILADKQRIQQAFLNLLKNGIEAVSEGGKVIVTAKRDNKSKTIEIEIRDTGIGIPAEDLPHIFDPFFTTKGVGKGTGLGLFVTHEIIEEHQGSIEVKSEVGKGTTFLIKLPQKIIKKGESDATSSQGVDSR